MMWLVLLYVLNIQLTVSQLTSGVQCLDESGDAVDWWFVYKMPNGFQYSYYDSNSDSGELTLAGDTLDCTTGCALGSTLHQIYMAKTTLAHVIYNDQPQGDKSSTSSGPNGGHVKGVLAADSDGGFWLVHSVPKFPDLGPPQFTWTASTIYGQSFLCVSLNSAGVEQAASELQYQDPNIYTSAMPDDLTDTYPQMTALYGGTRQKGSSVLKIKSSGGTQFTDFAKDNTWGQDLYDDLVEPYFKLAFQWQTWRRAPFLPSLCTTPFDTLNVASIDLDGNQFSYTQDHSKWGVSLTGTKICVGGINRMQSQRNRGGGTLCLSDSDFWKALSGVVASAEQCSAESDDAKPKSKPKPKPKPKGKTKPKPKPKPKSKGPARVTNLHSPRHGSLPKPQSPPQAPRWMHTDQPFHHMPPTNHFAPGTVARSPRHGAKHGHGAPGSKQWGPPDEGGRIPEHQKHHGDHHTRAMPIPKVSSEIHAP